ncbi:MAG: AAA family ATPase [Candidatus Sedimenticola sp. (ex Thyasira tokunagai)]
MNLTAIIKTAISSLSSTENTSRPRVRNENSEKFNFRSLKDIVSNLAAPQYLIQDYLSEDGVVSMFGESGVLKSFVALDMGLSVAYKIKYHGKKVKHGATYYICGEGHGGLGKRIVSWQIHHNITDLDAPFFVSEIPAQLIEEGDVIAIKESIEETYKDTGIKPALIIIDTLSTNFGNGDESSNRDVARLLQNENIHLRQPYGAVVLNVLHVGHGDIDRERGAYALRANVDSRIAVKKNGELSCRLICKKVKDESEWDDIVFKAKQVEIPGLFDSEGMPITSLVLDESSSCGDDIAKGPHKNLQKLIMDALMDMCIKELLGKNWGQIGIGREEFVSSILALHPEKKRFNINRSLDNLIDNKDIIVLNNFLVTNNIMRVAESAGI